MDIPTVTLSSVLWTVTFALLLAGSIVAIATDELALGVALMAHGLVCSAAAATVTVRGYIVKLDNRMTEVFQIGRDHGAQLRNVRDRG